MGPTEMSPASGLLQQRAERLLTAMKKKAPAGAFFVSTSVIPDKRSAIRNPFFVEGENGPRVKPGVTVVINRLPEPLWGQSVNCGSNL